MNDTPMMQQYKAVRDQYPNCLLFYRMGDFYELFGDHARTAAGLLNITLTQRRTSKDEDGIPMCGVPFHAAEGYISKLLDKGLKVALCEQVETPEEAKARGSKALVRRDVVRLYTPGTLTEDALLTPEANNYLAVVIPAGDDRVALGWLDVSTGEVGVSDVTAGQLAAELARLDPPEILTPADGKLPDGPWAARQSLLTAGQLAPANAERLLLKAYNVATLAGLGLLAPAHIVACGALLAYVEQTQVGKLPKLRAPKVHGLRQFLALDAATRTNLELATTLRGERNGSLLHALDATVTAPGARLLAQWVTAPLADADAINARLDALEFFLTHGPRRDTLRDGLRHTADLGRALGRLTLGRGGPRDLSSIRQTLAQAPGLLQALDGLTPPRLVAEAAAALHGFDTLIDTLTRALAEDPLPLLAREGGFVRAGYCATLDGYRDLAHNGLKLLQDMEAREAERTGISSLRIRYNKVWGYYIEVTNTHLAKVPADYVHRQTTTSTQRFSTPELMTLERDLGAAEANALARELDLFQDLVTQLTAQTERLLLAADAFAFLDVATASALLAQQHRYTRPLLSDDRTFVIQGGRHPVVERRVPTFMANGCDLTGGQLWLLTGPNMAGKSTFLRQNALIALMAHAGLFVPADSARLGVMDRIFTRIGAADDLARGQSTFMVEMVETAAILNGATDRSLVILDEIGRGTATFDGLSIAWACVEYLAKRCKSRALFATHYHELTALEGKLPSVSCHHVAVQEWQNDIVFLHEVRKGVSPRSYGIHVGRLAGLPPEVTVRAAEVLAKLEREADTSEKLVAVDQMSLFSQPVLPPAPSAVETRLLELALDDLSPRQAQEALYDLRKMLAPRKAV